jgi:hypothetical protein
MNPSNNPSIEPKPLLSPAWQQNLVLIAKNTPVWLAQLSREYQREIKTLDQIPDQELERLKSYGITGLWLVGVWQRSPASKKIKHLYGFDQLIASAYSILDYKIAEDLGGESALEKLKTRAQKKGIYLACDMVPNHTAIDSPWLIKHPDWYINSKSKPVDSWMFESPDLSPDSSVIIRLENGYYSQTGAAEAFLYEIKKTNRPLYIYHGNDGTSMPWNDTAQLDYLNPRTRTAMKNRIIEVAKIFSIVRMDAAMTLLKQHFKRLWYPNSGADANIPTRIENTMNQEEFDILMPDEFWGEIIEMLAIKAPDTLILAEAFWMMEKYFVQSLGMHRVYNSAFLNCMREEENKIFRDYLIEILGSDRFILNSFVNYMTTPDEIPTTTVFGKGKKYFGVFGFMATLPGLPLIGHGQIEGFAEKFGMDFGKPFLDETPDNQFINDHLRLIAPLLCNRNRFSSSQNLTIYDFTNDSSKIDENVFVLTNNIDSQRTLIIFNNQDKSISGKITQSALNQISKPKNLLSGLNIEGQDQLNLREIRFGDQKKIPANLISSKGLEIQLKPYDLFVYNVN